MKQKILPDNKLYILKEVKDILRVSERTMFRYIHSGKLRATKIGNWRISGADLKKFLLENSNVRNAAFFKGSFISIKRGSLPKANKPKK